MTVVVVGRVAVASVYAAGSTGRQDPLVPTLFRATLVTMHNDRILFKGYERPGGFEDLDTDKNRQDWAVQVIIEQPHIPAPLERMG